ncbi:conserved exported hypothetical protein [Tenacibaculum litopenaei]|uniref:hypothetical protein n=1 Tax=Tenacibaculum litopenaei TaxID=396016 RepID=UPI00389515BE
MYNKRFVLRVALLLLSLGMMSNCKRYNGHRIDAEMGYEVQENGMTCDSLQIVLNGSQEARTAFVYGEKVSLTMSNVRGFEERRGKKYPGCSLEILNAKNEKVYDLPDVYKNIKRGIHETPLELTAGFKATFDYEKDENFLAVLKVWDKVGKGMLEVKLPFTIVKNEVVQIENKGLKYSNIYLWNASKKEVLALNSVSIHDDLLLVLDGISGLQLKGTSVFPALEIELKDANGNLIMFEENLFQPYESTGVDPKELQEQISLKLNFTQGAIYNPCSLNVVLRDQNSSKKIHVETQLEIEN